MEKNKPYVKTFNKEEEITNPIIGVYSQPFPTRKARRIFKNRERFTGNGKTTALSVVKTMKFRRYLQFVPLRDKDGLETGELRRIEHYLSN